MKWGWRTVLGRVLVTTARTQLRDPLDMNAQGLELLPDDALRHATAQVFHQQQRTAVPREREGVETHTSLINGPQRADRGSKTVSV